MCRRLAGTLAPPFRNRTQDGSRGSRALLLILHTREDTPGIDRSDIKKRDYRIVGRRSLVTLVNQLKNMYFVQYQPLKERLRSRSVSDREALPYFLLYVGIASLAVALPLSSDYNLWDGVSGGLSFVLAIWGVFYAYQRNGGNEGFDLIQKYVVLGWVVFFRCLLLLVPLGILVGIVGYQIGLVGKETHLFDVLVVAVFEWIVYSRIGRHIADTRVEKREVAGDSLSP